MKLKLIEQANDEELDALEDDYPSAQTISPAFKKIADKAVKTFSKHIPLWDNIHVHYSDDIGNVLGVHRAESESRPIIVLSPKNIKRVARRYGVDLETGIQTTIWHELGHSFYEYCEVYDLPLPADEEKFAEGIADELWNTFGVRIPNYAEKLLKKIKRIENGV